MYCKGVIAETMKILCALFWDLTVCSF